MIAKLHASKSKSELQKAIAQHHITHMAALEGLDILNPTSDEAVRLDSVEAKIEDED